MTARGESAGSRAIPFEKLGCDECVMEAFDAVNGELVREGRPCVPGRVVSLDRGFPMVRTRDDEVRAELSAAIKKSEDGIVAVGDWVALAQPAGHDKAIVERVLPRRTELARVKRVGRERAPRRQVLAANVDTVFICQALTGGGPDFNLLVRQMAAVMGCGAVPVFLFTKGDLVDDSHVEEWRSKAGRIAPDVTCAVVSENDEASIEGVRAMCPAGTTGLLLGESGVGKSSLVNALAGMDVADVGEVRASDDKGRHTTVARRMLEVPGGGAIIDAPGLRTLQILDVDECLHAAFPDVYDAAQRCRFSDCAHESEPGCAVREEVNPERLEAYRHLLGSDWRKRGASYAYTHGQ